jgi:hypothetical protein
VTPSSAAVLFKPNCVRIKDGVEFIITSACIHMMSALDMVARQSHIDLWITSGSDGKHSGPLDPHKFGKALDVRTHNLPDKQIVLNRLRVVLPEDRFYVFIEDPDEVTHADPDKSNEHIHMQVKQGTEYP